MLSFQQSFEELRTLMTRGRGLTPAGDDPVYYVVFPPREMIEVKRKLKVWAAKLKKDRWTVETFSMADAIETLMTKNDLWELWIKGESDAPFDFAAINATVTDVLTSEGGLKSLLEAKLSALKRRTKTVLFITDLEALHPYQRVGAIEHQLQGKFSVPTVIFYPGSRAGKTSLRFLEIYPADGNYRSIHLGG